MEQTMGQRISALRKKNGYTQDQLAQKVGVTPQAVSKWENDQACPDVSIIPELAKLFGVSTDVLYGTSPMPDDTNNTDNTKEVFTINDKEQSVKVKGHKAFKLSWLTFPIFLITLGLCLFLNKSQGIGNSFWSILWPTAVFCIGLGITFVDIGGFSLGVTGLGIYFILNAMKVIPENILSPVYVIAGLLVLWAIGIIIDHALPKRKRKHKYIFNVISDSDDESKSGGLVTDCSVDDGFLNCNIKFAEYKYTFRTEVFRGGDVNVAFGEAVICLADCDEIEENAVLDVDVAFGEAKIIVPRYIKAETHVSKGAAEVTVKGEPDEDAEKTIRINIDVKFGSVAVVYR